MKYLKSVPWYLIKPCLFNFNLSLNYNFQNTFLVPLYQLLIPVVTFSWMFLFSYRLSKIDPLYFPSLHGYYIEPPKYSNYVTVEHSCDEWLEKYFIFLPKLVLLTTNTLAVHEKWYENKILFFKLNLKIVSLYFWKQKV